MTPRQCEIAAESYTASLLAQSGYDVLVQYGANQPDYDLVAVKGPRILKISVKGSQDGGWMFAVKYLKPGVSYHAAIDAWRVAQKTDIVFVLVQYLHVSLGDAPRVYVARAPEMADYMKTERNGEGHGSLQEDYHRDHPRSQYHHKIPAGWKYTLTRINSI